MSDTPDDLQRLFSADFDTPDVNKLVRTHLGAILQGLTERLDAVEDAVEEVLDNQGSDDSEFWQEVANRATATLIDCATLFDSVYKKNGWLGQNGLTPNTPSEFRDAFLELGQRIASIAKDVEAGPPAEDEDDDEEGAE